jgi:hypothetical protein
MYMAVLKPSITGENRRDYATGAGLLPLAHVQFWQTENGGRLDRSHCGRHRRDISGLVDASDVRTVNAVENDRGHKPLLNKPARTTSAIAIIRRRAGRDSSASNFDVSCEPIAQNIPSLRPIRRVIAYSSSSAMTNLRARRILRTRSSSSLPS